MRPSGRPSCGSALDILHTRGLSATDKIGGIQGGNGSARHAREAPTLALRGCRGKGWAAGRRFLNYGLDATAILGLRRKGWARVDRSQIPLPSIAKWTRHSLGLGITTVGGPLVVAWACVTGRCERFRRAAPLEADIEVRSAGWAGRCVLRGMLPRPRSVRHGFLCSNRCTKD